MTKDIFFEPSFDKETCRTAVIDRWCDLTQPVVRISIPARAASGQRIRSSVRGSLGDDMIATSKQPLQFATDLPLSSHRKSWNLASFTVSRSPAKFEAHPLSLQEFIPRPLASTAFRCDSPQHRKASVRLFQDTAQSASIF